MKIGGVKNEEIQGNFYQPNNYLHQILYHQTTINLAKIKEVKNYRVPTDETSYRQVSQAYQICLSRKSRNLFEATFSGKIFTALDYNYIHATQI